MNDSVWFPLWVAGLACYILYLLFTALKPNRTRVYKLSIYIKRRDGVNYLFARAYTPDAGAEFLLATDVTRWELLSFDGERGTVRYGSQGRQFDVRFVIVGNTVTVCSRLEIATVKE